MVCYLKKWYNNFLYIEYCMVFLPLNVQVKIREKVWGSLVDWRMCGMVFYHCLLEVWKKKIQRLCMKLQFKKD